MFEKIARANKKERWSWIPTVRAREKAFRRRVKGLGKVEEHIE